MPMLTLAVQFFLGLLYADAGEWLMHKYIPQALGNKPYSFQAYHLYEHHAVCASNSMLDQVSFSLLFVRFERNIRKSSFTVITVRHRLMIVLI
ncbi:MAG: hypothetical protein LUQ56_08580 [Methylococcaceae bacterium]|jgi:hypothetical protein|nr:hypothetical protein [Methylococcaceae bacterium]